MSLRHRASAERGQAIVLVVAVLAILIGIAALVIDGGSWLRAQRHLQTAADAGALAGAQNLPTDQSGASSIAISYAQQNFPGMPAPTVTFPDAGTIDVAAQTTAPGFLAKIYGSAFSNVTIRAHARAGVSVPAFLKNVAPVAVKNTVACAATNPGCYGRTVTLVFDESQVASSTIGLIDLTCHSTQSNACGSTAGIGGSQLESWIENGFPDAAPRKPVVRGQDRRDRRAGQARLRADGRHAALLPRLRPGYEHAARSTSSTSSAGPPSSSTPAASHGARRVGSSSATSRPSSRPTSPRVDRSAGQPTSACTRSRSSNRTERTFR